ncbi:UvrB/UvrC motif-containing protein [Macrococcus sp. DPC7161]|uniref:UvrB/UvrC motif-containing protein n=1 Tax=Macrococcus sp. DPC7161 TaxID=2507060 RepID=UPI00100BF101|nr:UvrB/UvrC motif-containing protein [Macrococcus sp. DPC7161]RXK17721.1 excinuclease ABC subunit B [Macrococcus sp. DPC7161]
MNQEEEFSMHQILKQLLNNGEIQITNAPVKCPQCELTLREVMHIGKFGCHQCYDTFKEHVPQIVSRVQAGNVTHVGKQPKKSQAKILKKREIERLEQELQILVEQQAFEKAVVIRDQIKALKESEAN